MQGKVDNVAIRGVISAVPKNEVNNLEYAELAQNRRLKKQVKLTGVYNRRVSLNGQKASDLATVVAEKLLEKLQWERESIRVMIFVTQSPDLQRPSSAFLIQERLGLSQECLVYDINMGCSGYIAGMTTICSLLQTMKGRGLLLVGESNAISEKEISNTALLEGDAAAATALEYTTEVCPDIRFEHWSDGGRAQYLYASLEQKVFMDGNAIFLFGLSDVADAIKKYMSDTKMSVQDIDYFVFHQAQKMIVDGIASEVGIPNEKVLMSCADYGNTSSASIPLTLCVHKKNIQGRKKILMCGYGIGLSWGIMQAELDFDRIFSIVETDYVYNDREKFE